MNMVELAQIQLNKDTNNELDRISKLSGLDKEKIIAKAISYYLDIIQKEVELKEEFAQWDKLSDEALSNFEAKL